MSDLQMIDLPPLGVGDKPRPVECPVGYHDLIEFATTQGWLSYGPTFDRSLRARVLDACRHNDPEQWRLFCVRYELLCEDHFEEVPFTD
jgi:hypothetical protein